MRPVDTASSTAGDCRPFTAGMRWSAGCLAWQLRCCGIASRSSQYHPYRMCPRLGKLSNGEGGQGGEKWPQESVSRVE